MARFIASIILGCLFLVLTGEAAVHPATVLRTRGTATVHMHGIPATLSAVDVAEKYDDTDPVSPIVDVATVTFSVQPTVVRARDAEFSTSGTDEPPIYIAIRRLLI